MSKFVKCLSKRIFWSIVFLKTFLLVWFLCSGLCCVDGFYLCCVDGFYFSHTGRIYKIGGVSFCFEMGL